MKTATKVNLFAAPKVKESAKKTTEKKIIKVDLLDDKIKRFNDLKNEIEAATGELKMIEGDIKGLGREVYLKEYRAAKMKPESFKMQDKTGATCLFICMDKYTIVDENKAEVLGQFNDLLDKKQTFKINADLVEKYGEVLSKLILGSKQIEEEDKLNLIQGDVQYSVKKGSLDRIMQYENPEMIFELINPIVALKK